MHRLDYKGTLPIGPTYQRGNGEDNQQPVGWCTWSAGGKNNHRYWTSAQGGGFDVEAADRRLNQYTQPGYEYYAPDAPLRLPADHVARQRDQAKVFQDPMDDSTYQRAWPQETLNISGYDDVGSSYHWNSAWVPQLQRNNPQIRQMFNVAQQRFASGEGVDPQRFVWMHDEEISLVINSFNRNLQISDNYGNINTSQMLFVDGHVGYHQTVAGSIRSSYSNANYTLIFSDLPNPGRPD